MSAPVIPRAAVAAPPAAQPHRFGLFTAAVILENADAHELTGIEYEAVCDPRVDAYPAACRPGDTTSRVKTPQPTTGVFNATPFAVYSADECVLGRDMATARAQLRERFLLGEETAVEQILFSGRLGNLPNLTINPYVIVPATTPQATLPDLPDAIGLLEQWLATNYGGIGTLHAPLSVAPRVQSLYELGVNGPRAGTVLGSSWVFGAGYPGTPPPADHQGNPITDDGALWLYATPPVTIRRSELIEPADWTTGAFNTSENTGMLITERLYVVDWPCGTAAVKTSLKRPGYNTPSAADPESTAELNLPADWPRIAPQPGEEQNE